ncbi:MAG TPA: acyl-CoA dehydrogenase family protein [Acidimicrobiales bacterium]|nr:acyl-CoA dehydrogenase family protein [Acidimicrobiales bacterium]
MLLELTPDQDFLRETTAKFLTARAPTEDIRRLRDDPTGFDREYWRRGADLGWTSLLVSEIGGGGSVSGQGLIDLTLIADEFGRHAAPGPLIPTSVVAAALDAAGRHGPELEALLSGAAVGSWCLEEPGWTTRLRDPQLTVDVDGDTVVLHGTKRPAESAADADFLLVTGATAGGLSQVLVPAGTPGVTIERMRSIDLTRRFGAVTFDHVRLPLTAVVGPPGRSAPAVELQLQTAIVMANAETVGAMAAAFDMTVEWAFDRYSFGRPLASYQELKHRFADMKSWLESGHAIADAAAIAVAEGAPNARHLVSVAKAFIGQYGMELLQDCVQIHGGIGVTFDHDLHLFLRRAALNRSLLGTPAAHRQRVADIVIEEGQ